VASCELELPQGPELEELGFESGFAAEAALLTGEPTQEGGFVQNHMIASLAGRSFTGVANSWNLDLVVWCRRLRIRSFAFQMHK